MRRSSDARVKVRVDDGRSGSGCVPRAGSSAGCPAASSRSPRTWSADPTFRPQIGDRAVLYATENGGVIDRYPLLRDVTAYDIYVRCQQTKDGERQLELEEQGWLEWASPGTRVSIMAQQDRTHTGAQLITQIRLTDVTQKNKTFWTAVHYITRLIHKEPE